LSQEYTIKRKLYIRILPRWLYFALNRYAHRATIKDGLPDGISFNFLREICHSRFGEKLRKVSYELLSGWKASGAYRLYLSIGKFRYLTLIYKNAVYSGRITPALTGLPVAPGPPEYYIYKYSHPGLCKYLPQVYHCEEIAPGEQYVYLLEDLKTDYYMAQGVDDLYLAARLLSSFHAELNRETAEMISQNALKFDQSFSTNLLNYVKTNLENYQKNFADNNVNNALSAWSEISARYNDRDSFRSHPKCLIHGDYNRTNLHISFSDSNSIKLVDWEWAGIGFPHADLASLLKGQKPEVEEKALRFYADFNKSFSFNDHKHLYCWCQLERNLLDAGFLARQHLYSQNEVDWIPNYIRGAIFRLLYYLEKMESTIL
jgi:aminoglycoside/choline kinase family phosphotransferase